METRNKRPWGYFQVLSDTPDHKVKRIVVEPRGSLSLQRHKMRSEHWYAIAGEGHATIDGTVIALRQGIAVDIPKGVAHPVSKIFLPKSWSSSKSRQALTLVKMILKGWKISTDGFNQYAFLRQPLLVARAPRHGGRWFPRRMSNTLAASPPYRLGIL